MTQPPSPQIWVGWEVASCCICLRISQCIFCGHFMVIIEIHSKIRRQNFPKTLEIMGLSMKPVNTHNAEKFAPLVMQPR